MLGLALLTVGIILIVTGIIGIIRNFRNAKRPRLDVIVNKITMDSSVSGKKRRGPQIPHGQVSYEFEGRNYETWVVLTRNAQERDRVQIAVDPGAPQFAELYAPGKAIKTGLFTMFVGVLLIAAVVGLTLLFMD